MSQHIINTSVTPATGVAVEFVTFSHQVCKVVIVTAKSVLSEIHCGLTDKDHFAFGVLHAKIQETANYWNTAPRISASMIRNAIRVLDVRINHCRESFKDGTWVFCRNIEDTFADGIIPKKDYKMYRKSNQIVDSYYNEATMALMIATRQILVDSLITISSEFE